jgi:putative transposase
MDERLKFIARLLDGEKMVVACRDFGISRKTGYKILTRYNEIGLDGLTDRSRRPYRHANQLPLQIETQIVRLKQDKPSWARRRSGRSSPDSIRMCTPQPSARSTRFSIAMGWSSAG